jgi:L-methionine (R)-S-oxide reductase
LGIFARALELCYDPVMSTTTISKISYTDKSKFYREVQSELSGLLEENWLMNLANMTALLKQHLPDINWVGFYLNHERQLLLGPFQGFPACTRINFGKGVCGTAALSKRALIVDDVDKFPGHIVCDSASRSEIVVPLVKGERILGVLDVDSPLLARFDSGDQVGLTKLVDMLVEKTLWPEKF